MHEHRLAKFTSKQIYPFGVNFSVFHFLAKKKYLDTVAIHRCFSLARSVSSDQKSFVFEELDPKGEGIVFEENNAMKVSFPDYLCKSLIRISFWRKDADKVKESRVSSDDLIGYLIIKHDFSLLAKIDSAHVFEAVFPKYDHPHNCSHDERKYRIRVGESLYDACGVIFCQQNSVFKCCAHVALFSILSLFEHSKEISFAKMNEIAGIKPPNTGLGPEAIRKILCYYGIDFCDIDYDEAEKENSKIKEQIPFQRLAYAGIESGGGALVGFSLEQQGENPPDRHMIPFFGHTFNKDTWVPHADLSYFRVSSSLSYIPSDSWTSSFIGHDDNFGANFCIPKLYIQKEKVNYAVELFRPGVKYSGLIAEAYAVQFLYSAIESCTCFEDNFWFGVLKDAVSQRNIILRTIALKKEEYFSSLAMVAGERDKNIIDTIRNDWPDVFWITEISLPQLFSANEEKIGEIIMDATEFPADPDRYSCFLAARLPKLWFFCEEEDASPKFSYLDSDIEGHIHNFTSFSPISP